MNPWGLKTVVFCVSLCKKGVIYSNFILKGSNVQPTNKKIDVKSNESSTPKFTNHQSINRFLPQNIASFSLFLIRCVSNCHCLCLRVFAIPMHFFFMWAHSNTNITPTHVDSINDIHCADA